MSWDISIIKFSKDFESVADIPESERPVSLGSRNSMHAAVSRVFVGVDWSDPAWGTWDGPHGSIEFNLGKADDIGSFMLHVRAAQEVVPIIVALYISNGWQGIDCSSGRFVEKVVDPTAGLRSWRDYSDQIRTERSS